MAFLWENYYHLMTLYVFYMNCFTPDYKGYRVELKQDYIKSHDECWNK